MKLGSEILYLSRNNIGSSSIRMSDVINLLEESFLEKAKGTVDALPKIELHPKRDDNFINAMVCSFPKFNVAGIKWISAYPGNREKDLPYLSGLIVLNDSGNRDSHSDHGSRHFDCHSYRCSDRAIC